MLELGFFLFFNILSFGLFGFGVAKRKVIFGDLLILLSMVFFFMLGFYMLPVEDIGVQKVLTSNATAEQWTETTVFIADAESFYLIYTYYGLALMAFITFMLGKIPVPDHWRDRF